MKNHILIIALFIGLIFPACSKRDNSCTQTIDAAPASEVLVLDEYIAANNIEAKKDERGFYYKVEALGTGTHPDLCSEIVVNYKGWLTNNVTFDQGENASFDLNGLIAGWQAGIPLIARGGRIILYLPPSLGYGSTATNGIPANSILIFSIDLVKIK